MDAAGADVVAEAALLAPFAIAVTEVAREPAKAPLVPSTFTPLDVNAFKIKTSPLICAACNKERLISKFSMLPLVDLITAGGCDWLAKDIEAAATGMIPNAARAGSELTGS